jgi:hypothetical protein
MRIFLLAAAIIAIALVLTNPGPDAFERFVEETVAEVLAAELSDLPAGPLVGQMGGALASRLARRYTVRDNYLLFSIYTLELRAAGITTDDWRFLGIGTAFIELDRPDQLKD